MGSCKAVLPEQHGESWERSDSTRRPQARTQKEARCRELMVISREINPEKSFQINIPPKSTAECPRISGENGRRIRPRTLSQNETTAAGPP
jgi:hypothetical protein